MPLSPINHFGFLFLLPFFYNGLEIFLLMWFYTVHYLVSVFTSYSISCHIFHMFSPDRSFSFCFFFFFGSFCFCLSNLKIIVSFTAISHSLISYWIFIFIYFLLICAIPLSNCIFSLQYLLLMNLWNFS